MSESLQDNGSLHQADFQDLTAAHVLRQCPSTAAQVRHDPGLRRGQSFCPITGLIFSPFVFCFSVYSTQRLEKVKQVLVREIANLEQDDIALRSMEEELMVTIVLTHQVSFNANGFWQVNL